MVSALVIVALSSMLVACDKKDDKNGASNGCTCTYEDGYKETYTSSEMKEEGISSCAELSSFLTYEEDETVTCK